MARLRDVAIAYGAYGNRFVASVGENWHTPSLFCALAFNVDLEIATLIIALTSTVIPRRLIKIS